MPNSPVSLGVLSGPVLTHSPEETEALGERFAAFLKRGAVVALYGGLGAGKTCFVRGLARGLAVAESVTSPTYPIINTYRGTLPGGEPADIHHIDAYRLRDADDFTDIGGEDLFAGNGVCIVEWPLRIEPCLPEDTIPVTISIKSGDMREIRIGR
jgi:tRNA threonylcarbamoyladenosine biosynthesis protein TsaE